MEQNETKSCQKVAPKYFCESCHYNTTKKSSFDKHLLTRKHLDETKTKQNMLLICECNKVFNSRTTLWRHKKKCSENNSDEEKKQLIEVCELANNIYKSSNIISQDMIIEIIKQNQEFKDLLLEQNKTIIELSKNSNTTNNTNITNSNNKTFNLQVFLNETCKNAMNIMDFVDSIKIQLSDIESIGELGYVNGMSKLIIKHLNALDENMRPIHCSDQKRESLYVKDQNVWEKEDPDNKKIKKAIKYISHKNICALPEWKAKYPDCIYSDSNKSDQYNHIVIEAMGGSGDNDAEKADKIVKKIAKAVTISKN
jgi:hypothetical protein